MTVNAATGSFTYTPTAAARYAAASPTATAADRADTFTVTISDGRGGIATKSVAVTVAGQAAAPSGLSLNITGTNADTGVVTGTVSATDPNGDRLTYTVAAQPTNGTLVFNASTGSFIYTPRLLARLNANQTPGVDTDNFTVTASDGTLTTTTSLAMPIIPAHFLVDNDSLATGPNSNSVAFSPDGTRAYITRDSYTGDPGAVYVIDTATNTILGSPITVGYRPQALVVSPDGTRLYVSGIGINANRSTAAITVINTTTNSVIGSPIFVGPASSSAFGIAITPDGGRLYVTDFDNGNITAVNTATRTVVGSPISLGRWAWGVVVSPDGKFAYATSSNAAPGSPGKVSIINTATNTVVGTIPVGASARGIALNSDATRAYVSNYGDGTVTVVNLTTNSVVGSPISVGMRPVGVALSPDGSIAYVTRFADQTPLLVAIDTVTNTVIGTPFIAADNSFDGYAAQQIATSKAANRTYSISLTDGTISIITVGSVANNGKPIAGTPYLTTDSAGVVTGSVPFTDPNGDTLRYTAAPGLKGTVTIDPVSGVFTYTPSQATRQRAATYNATAADREDIVVVLADDGNAGVTAVSVTVPVRPAESGANNQAPIAGNPVLGTADAVTGAVSGSAAFSDPDDDTLHYEISEFAQKGTLGVDPTTGVFTYTPYLDYRHIATTPTATTAEKTDTFTVTASDQWGHSTSATVTVTISPYNSAPTFQLAQVDTAALSGTVSGKVYFYDSDYRPTNDTLSYTATTSSRGSVTINSAGDFTYTPSAAARNKAASPTAQPADLFDSIVVTVNDGHGGTASTTVLVAILPAGVTPNRGLTNYGGYTVTSENNTTGATTGTPAFFDPDNDTLRYFTSGAGRGTVSVSPTTGAFTYTPSAQAQHDAAMASDDGRDTFTIVAVDGHGNVAVMPISLAIGTQNTKPLLGSTTFGNADPITGAIIGKVTVTDPDNDTLTYVGPATTAKGSVTVDRQTGAFTYTPAPAARFYAAAAGATADDKTDSFTITAYDNRGAYVSTVVSLTISPSAAPNRAPIQISPTTVGTPDPTTGAVSGHLHLTDLDQDGLTFSFEPIAGSRSEDGVFIADDGRFTIDGQTGKWTFVPTDARRHEAAADDGRPDIYSFHWTATDTRGASISGDISVPITPLNAAPAVNYATQTRDPSTGVITGRFTAQDTDGDYLKVSVSRQPAGGTVVAQWVGGSTYQWTYTPNELDAYYRPDFTLTVTDGHGGQSSIYETADKQAPTSTAAPIITDTSTNAPTDAATGAVSGKIFVPGSAGRTLTYTRTVDAGKGTVSVNPTTGAYTYTPTVAARQNAAAVNAPASALTDSFVVTVTEGGQTVSVMTIVVPISPLNRRPATTIATDPPDGNGVVRGRVTAVDPDGDALTISAAATSRLHGSVSFTGDGSFIYEPDLAYRTYAASHPGTTDFFVVTITEANGRSSLVRVPVTIAPLNLPPAPPTPVNPPTYPPAPAPTNNPGPGSPVTNPNPRQPKGPTVDDVFKNPNRIGVINAAIEVTTTKQYEQNMHDGGWGVGATIYQYSAVTVKYSADKPAAPGDVYVLQISEGHVTGFQLLKPGESATGRDVFWSYTSLSGGGYGNPDRVVVVTFAAGTFPYRYWPGSTPNNGGDPVRGPDDPTWTPYSDIEDEVANVLDCYRRVSCLLPIGAKTAEIAANFGPGMQGSQKAKIIADLVKQAVDEHRDQLLGEDAEAAARQLLQQCIDGLGNSAT
ncbi:MAG: Ig-like domain-containing protein [Mycobacterium kyogaense]